jgi:hypothetical protein
VSIEDVEIWIVSREDVGEFDLNELGVGLPMTRKLQDLLLDAEV